MPGKRLSLVCCWGPAAFHFRNEYVVKVFGEGRFALSSNLSVWQNWFDFKPDSIINHQSEFSGKRVKYLDHEKRAYKHEIWSYRIFEKASNNRSFWRVQSEVV